MLIYVYIGQIQIVLYANKGVLIHICTRFSSPSSVVYIHQ